MLGKCLNKENLITDTDIPAIMTTLKSNKIQVLGGTVWMVRGPPLGCVEVEVCPVNLVSSLETKTWADGDH